MKSIDICSCECCQQNYVTDAMCFLVNTQLVQKTSFERFLKQVCLLCDCQLMNMTSAEYDAISCLYVIHFDKICNHCVGVNME